MRGLDTFVKQSELKFVAKLGVLRGTTNRDSDADLDNAAIGLKHEVGSLSENIPMRSWLRMPIRTRNDEIAKKIAPIVKKNLAKEGGSLDTAKKLGVIGEAIVQEAFESRGFGKWQPNSPTTIADKGSDSPLIDTAEFRQSITSAVKKA